MDYIEVSIRVNPFTEDYSEIVLAIMEDFNFDSFSVEDPFVKGYIKKDCFREEDICSVRDCFTDFDAFDVTIEHTLIKGENWNALWESNFPPLVIDDICTVKASFHKDLPDTKYNITIDPKMAFGTGHHQTTHLMASNLLKENLSGRRVLDMGCGTAILAILSAMMGAEEVLAVDNDIDAVNSSIENSYKNGVSSKVKALLGDANLLKEVGTFSLILANINRNIIINDMAEYSNSLESGGVILLSGFYRADVDLIKTAGEKVGLKFTGYQNRDEWAFLRLQKKKMDVSLLEV